MLYAVSLLISVAAVFSLEAALRKSSPWLRWVSDGLFFLLLAALLPLNIFPVF